MLTQSLIGHIFMIRNSKDDVHVMFARFSIELEIKGIHIFIKLFRSYRRLNCTNVILILSET